MGEVKGDVQEVLREQYYVNSTGRSRMRLSKLAHGSQEPFGEGFGGDDP
jgi:hypothetical protein